MSELASALRFAVENPYSDFYRRKYGTAHTSVPSRQLHDIPFLTRAEIESTPFYERLFVPRVLVRFLRLTSGSSGRRIIAFPAIETYELAQYRSTLGFSDDAYQGRYFGPHFSKDDSYTVLMFSAGSPVHTSQIEENDRHRVVDGDFQLPELTVRLAKEAGADAILTFPSPLLGLSPQLAAAGVSEKIKFIMFAGERVPQMQHKALVEAFPNASMSSLYASNETQGMAGHTCLARLRESPNFIHPFSHNYYFELIDPDTGVPVAITTGAEGEIVLTARLPFGFPLVRYRTGDYAAVTQTGDCRCGSKEPMIDVLGRVTLDRVKVPHGGISVAALEEAIASLPLMVVDFSATWDQRGERPYLSVVLYGTFPAGAHDTLAGRLSAALHINAVQTYSDLVELGDVGPLRLSSEPDARRNANSLTKRKRLTIVR